jgi:hypothetical protein
MRNLQGKYWKPKLHKSISCFPRDLQMKAQEIFKEKLNKACAPFCGNLCA